jgi:cell division protein FtsW
MTLGRIRLEKMITSPVKNTDLWALVILIAGTGLSFLFSATWYFSRSATGNPWRILIRQAVWLLLGTVAAVLVSRLSRNRIRNAVPVFTLVVFILNILTFLPFVGITAGGARRWLGLDIGGILLSFQPSELIKLVFALYLARMFEKNTERKNDFIRVVLPPLLVVFLFCGIVYLQNDFSTSVFLFFIAAFMLFVWGAGLVHMGVMFGLFSIGAFFMVIARTYRMERVFSWLNPEKDPLDTGYQALKARYALQAGRFFGRGIGEGLSKRGGLPQAHSDYIVAVIGEETGLVGIVAVMALFFVVFIVSCRWFLTGGDLFSRYAVLGLGFALFFQSLVNMGVACGFFPATGIPLPLFSAGGSAAFTTMVIFGVMAALMRGEEKTVTREALG